MPHEVGDHLVGAQGMSPLKVRTIGGRRTAWIGSRGPLSLSAGRTASSEDVELIESLTNKVQPSVSHREEHGRMTLKHTTKHMDALQHWLEAEREVRNSHKDDSTREN